MRRRALRPAVEERLQVAPPVVVVVALALGPSLCKRPMKDVITRYICISPKILISKKSKLKYNNIS